MNKRLRRLMWHIQRTGVTDMEYTCPCCGHKEEITTEKNIKAHQPHEERAFETFRTNYKGKKRGLETEFNNFKKHKDWRTVLPKLHSMNIKWGCEDKFIPHLQTFINQRRWEMIEDVKPVVNPYGEQHNWRKS
jgi:wobble nucleotide-excising tRNase